jgi:RHS repeat-associated protein
MARTNPGFRTAVVLTLAASGWFACSTGDHRRELPDEGVAVATKHEALDPAWTPGSSAHLEAWYTAASNKVLFDLNSTAVNTWLDQSLNGRNVTQTNTQNKPQYVAGGWALHQDVLNFNGGKFLHLDNWPATPAGTDTALTVLAVLRPTAAVDGKVAGWWDPNGGGFAWAGFVGADGRTLADMGRTSSVSPTQTFNSQHDLVGGKHAIAWRYLPASHTMNITVDGTPSTSATLPTLDPLPQMSFIVGAGNLLVTKLFQGDLAELAVYSAPLTDDEIANFTAYAQSHWSGLPATTSSDPCVDANNQPTPPTTRCDDLQSTTYGDHCVNGTCVGTVPPPGSPADLHALAWYHAGEPEITQRDGGVETWFDRTTNRLDLRQGFYFNRPTISSRTWTPTSTRKPFSFVGHTSMTRGSWTGTPSGSDAEFTVLGVLQTNAAAQTAGVAAWWSAYGSGRIGCDLKTSGTGTVLDLFRADPGNTTQDFTGSTIVPTGKHAVAWRYSSGLMRLTIDGTTVPSSSLTPITALEPELFLIGADSGVANSLLNANVAELSVIGRAITDAELSNFDSYAQNEWGGLTLCAANCVGKACGADNGCGGICECGPACTTDAQCALGFHCSAGQCVSGWPTHCSNGTRDGDETAADCGGSCGNCAGASCSSTADCAGTLSCINGTCTDCSAPCANALCGGSDACGGTCPCGTKAPGDPCVGDADCANALHCSAGQCGGAGAACGTCASGLACTDGTCQCSPQCDGKACGAPNGCGGNCACNPGTTGCSLNSDCAASAICINKTCMLPECLTSPRLLGCGSPSSVCGPSCTPHPTCTSDGDCVEGYHCPQNNGWRYGVSGLRVCERPACATTPDVLGCGSAFSECGICYCAPQCQNKHCGDTDLSDGCGGTCTGLCAIGQNCERDVECSAGVCRSGVCRPTHPCADLTVQPPNCGSGSSTCGPCLNARVPTNPQCGVDTATQIDAGPCPANERCTAAGQCVPSLQLPPIVVSESGTSRVVIPPVSPASKPVGAIPAHFEVSDRGSATYTVPIEVPPGGPITPSLALRYASSTGNGALGIGWSLDGLSQISRCPRTYAQDGSPQGITGTDADALCLDGQRLYQTINEPADHLDFHTAVESFTLVRGLFNTHHSTLPGNAIPDYFIAYTKDGRKLTYDVPGLLANGANDLWFLTRVEDRSGNFMTIQYVNSVNTTPIDANGAESTAEMLPDVITYGGYDNTIDGDRTIRFNYDLNRGDKMLGWRAPGTLYSRSYLLTSIEISAGTGRVRSYHLNHDLVRGVTRLTSLQECSSADYLCKPLTGFEYYDDYGFEDEQTVTFTCAETGEGCNGADATIINGINPFGYVVRENGKDHLATATTITSVDTGLVSFFDAIGMGATILGTAGQFAIGESLIQGFGSASGINDALGIDNTEFVPLDVSIGGSVPITASYAWTAERFACAVPARQPVLLNPFALEPTVSLLSTCKELAPTHKNVQVANSSTEGGATYTWEEQQAFYYPQHWYVDVNGDGLQDRLQCASDTNPDDTTHLTIAYATRSGAEVHVPTLDDPPNGPPLPAFSDMCIVSCNEPEFQTCNGLQFFSTLLDVNGDGTNELVAADSQNHLSALVFDRDAYGNVTPTWHDEFFSGVTLAPNDRDYVVVMDANGDGLRDLVGLPQSGVDPTVNTARIAYNTGAGFTESQLSADDNTAIFAPQFSPFVMDYDHDGADDLLEPVSADVAQWRIRHFKDGQATYEMLPIASGPGTMGDFDGDGNMDLLTGATSYGGGNFRLSRGRGRHDHLLKAITDGMGRFITVQYDGTVPQNSLDDPHSLMLGTNDAVAQWQPGWPVAVDHLGPLNHPVVSTHNEGHYLTQARSSEASQFDRQFAYAYGLWATDTAGYGPLGFDSRLIIERDGDGAERNRRLIEFNLTQPDTSGPYVRPFTGLPVKITELPRSVDETTTTHGYDPRTETTFDWELGQLESIPFPYLHQKTSQTGLDYNSGEIAAHDMLYPVLAERVEVSEVDDYGNVWHRDVSGTDIPHTITERGFNLDVDNWLVGLYLTQDKTSWPANCTSNCDEQKRHRHEDFTYYPGTNLVETIHRAPGDPTLDRRTTLGREVEGNVTQVLETDSSENSREIDIKFDDRHLFPISITRVGDGTSQKTRVQYDDRFGTLTIRVDPNGIDETWSYDDFGVMRLYHGPNGDGSVDYDIDDDYLVQQPQVGIAASYKVTSSHNGGESTVDEYNSFDQLVRTTTTGLKGVQVSQEREYDHWNRLFQAFRPHADNDGSQGSTIYLYDSNDRVTDVLQSRSITSAGSGELDTKYFYGLSGQVKLGFSEMGGMNATRVVDPTGRVTTKSYNAVGQVVMAYDREGDDPLDPNTDHPFATTYHYGAFGDLIDIDTGQAAPPLTLTRDDYGRVTQSSQPYRGLEEASITYDAFDEPVHTFDHAGRERHLFYDDFGRLDLTYDDDGDTQWIYDVAPNGGGGDTIGRLVQTISPSGQTVDYGYEGPLNGRNRGLLSNITEHLQSPAQGGTTVDLSVDYTYDDFSRLSRIDYPAVAGSRFSVQYCPDANGHVVSVRDPNAKCDEENSTGVYWQLVDPDQGFRVGTERLGNGTCNGSGVLTTRHFDEHTGKLDDIQSECGGNLFRHLTYRYNDSGSMVSRGNPAPTETFDYDNAGRIQTVNGALAFTYSSVDHGLSYQNGVGEYTPQLGDDDEPRDYYWTHDVDQNTYLRNAAGAQTSRSGPNVQGQTQSITYTTFDLPTHVAQGSSYAVDFRYDASGTRAVKTATGLTGEDATFYVGDLFQRVEHSQGTPKNRNMIYAGGRLVAIATNTDDDPAHPTLHYLHDDAIGSIQAITAPDGTVEATRDFSAFGVERGGQALFDEVPYGFTGQEHDADLGLVNMHGRIYDPVLAQFLSPDPYMATPYGHGINAFAYVNNRPLDFTDPSGFVLDNDDQSAILFGAYSAGIIGGPACSAYCGALGGAIGSFFSWAGNTVLPTVGSALATVGPIGFEAAQIAARKPNPTNAEGIVQGRGAQSAGSPPNKVTSNDPMNRTMLDPGRSTIRMPIRMPNDCTMHPGLCLAEGPPGAEGSRGSVDDNTGGTGSRTDLPQPGTIDQDCEAGESDCIGFGAGVVASTLFSYVLPKAPPLPGLSTDEINAANALKETGEAPTIEITGEADVYYHYTTAPESSFANGFWKDASVTNVGDYTESEASELLGIPKPNKVIPIIGEGGAFEFGGTVGASTRYSGGALQWFARQPIPAVNILPAEPLALPP